MSMPLALSSERLIWAMSQRRKGKSWDTIAGELRVTEHQPRTKMDPEYMNLYKGRETRRAAKEQEDTHEPMPKPPLLWHDPLLDKLRAGLK